MTHWIKLYCEILHDPKMGKMSDHLWRRCIEIFLLAGEIGKDGALPTEEDMAYILRCKPSELTTDIAKLRGVGIVELVDNRWVVSKFAYRQAPSDAAIRMRNYREQLRNSNNNSSVTPINQNQSQNRTEQNQSQKRDDDGLVFEMFENNICILNARMAEQLGDAIDTYGRDRVIEGIKIASDNNGRTVKYLLTVLENRKNGKDFQKKKAKVLDRTSEEARTKYGEWETGG